MAENKEKKKALIKDIGINKLLIMFIAGILLVIISFADFGEEKKVNEEESGALLEKKEGELTATLTGTVKNAYEEILEERLEEFLTKATGIGKTEVMITIKASGEQIILKEKQSANSTLNEDDGQGGTRNTMDISAEESVVYIEDSNGLRTPYVIKETTPEIEGVVVIAEGGNDISVVSNIMDAVKALFDVPSHKIKVLEMK